MIARFLSYLFHPIFAPLFSIHILLQLPVFFNYKLSTELIQFSYGVVVLNLIVTPVLISLYLKKKGVIKSLEMESARERVIPYLTSSILFFTTYFLFKDINFPTFYLNVLLAAAIVILVLFVGSLINLKLSAHLAGLGGLCGMIFLIVTVLKIELTALFILFILISGLVASSRYFLKAHSFSEIISGFCLGFGIQLLVFY